MQPEETLPAKRKESPLSTVRRALVDNTKAVTALLSGYMPMERFMGGIVTACRINPELLDCTPDSIMLSALRLAQLRLSPDPALGQAYLVPRKGMAEFQLGYRGALQLAYRSPLVKDVRYNVVRAGEHFVWRDGRDWHLEHIPGGDGWPTTWEDLVAAWCVIDLANGGQIPRVMYKADILRHKSHGRGTQPAWQSDLAAMAAKTVIGDCCDRAPIDGEALLGIRLDRDGEAGIGQLTADLEEMTKPPEAAQRAAQAIVASARRVTQEDREAATDAILALPAEGFLSPSIPPETAAAVLAEQARNRELLGEAPPKPWQPILDMKLPRVGDDTARALLAAGLDTPERIHAAGLAALEGIPRIGKLVAQGILLRVEQLLDPEPEPEQTTPNEPSPEARKEMEQHVEKLFDLPPGHAGLVLGPAPTTPPPLGVAQAVGSIFPQPQPAADERSERASAAARAYTAPSPVYEVSKVPVSKIQQASLERAAVRAKSQGVKTLREFLRATFGCELEQLSSTFFRAAFEWADSRPDDAEPESLKILRQQGLAK